MLWLTRLIHIGFRVYDLEAKLAVESTFRYPSFRYLHWHLGSTLADRSLEEVHQLTTSDNLQALVAALNEWKVNMILSVLTSLGNCTANAAPASSDSVT